MTFVNVSREETEPDPTREPFAVRFLRTDDGGYGADVRFGGMNPFRACELLLGLCDSLLDDVRETRPDRLAQMPNVELSMRLVQPYIHVLTAQLGGLAEYTEHSDTPCGATDSSGETMCTLPTGHTGPHDDRGDSVG